MASEIEIPYHPRYVIDACILLAYLDPSEPHHAEAVAFFKLLDKFGKNGQETEVILPAHLYLEVNLNIEKKKEEVKLGKRAKYETRTNLEEVKWTGYPISVELMKTVEDKGLYEKFGTKLRMGDFIYAAIAEIESIPVVTLDKGFSKVSSDIQVILLI